MKYDRYGGVFIKVLGSISLSGCMDLQVIDRGDITHANYQDGVLQPIRGTCIKFL